MRTLNERTDTPCTALTFPTDMVFQVVLLDSCVAKLHITRADQKT